MDFVLLIHGDEMLWDSFTENEREQMAEAHRQFGRSMVEGVSS